MLFKIMSSSRKLYVDSRVKFRFPTEQFAVSFIVRRSDMSEAGERTEASGNNLELGVSDVSILWFRNTLTYHVQAAMKVASLAFLTISQFRKNCVQSSVAENRPSIPLIVIAFRRNVYHILWRLHMMTVPTSVLLTKKASAVPYLTIINLVCSWPSI